MAYIKLKDYLESLSTKGSSSDGDLLPMLDSGASNALKTVTKGNLVSLDDIGGFTAFSQSVENQLANTSQFSESLDDTFAKDSEVATTASLINSSITSVSTNLSNYETENDSVVQAIQAYTSSLKGAITVSGDDVSIKGTLTTNNFFAQYITSSILITTGSNKFGDNTVDKHEFTGSVHFTDTIYLDGEPIGLDSLNAFSSSVNNSIVQIGNHTSSVDNSVILFGAHTASQATINSGIAAVTGAFATELSGIQTTLSGHRLELNGIEAWTASLDDTFATDAQLYRLYQATRSLEVKSGSVDNSIVQIGNHTSSVDNSITLFGAHTASQSTINDGISAVTGAFATELGEIQTQLTNRRGELNGLEAYTASLKSVSVVSGSSQIDVTQTTNYGSINQYTDSDNLSYLNSLLVVSKSAGGDLDVDGDITGSSLNIIDTSNPGSDYGSVVIEGRRDGSPNVLTLRAKDNGTPASALPQDQGAVMRWQGFDGTDFANMGYILVAADGQAVAASDAPSYMAFGVSPDGSETPSEVMRLDSDGVLSLNDTSNDVFINNNGTAMEIDVNRHPETGVFSDTGKGHARISLIGDTGGSKIQFKTANAINTTATTVAEISSGSLSISGVAKLVSQNPLPTGEPGMLAVSSSASNEKLYFHDGSSWREVSLV